MIPNYRNAKFLSRLSGVSGLALSIAFLSFYCGSVAASDTCPETSVQRSTAADPPDDAGGNKLANPRDISIRSKKVVTEQNRAELSGPSTIETRGAKINTEHAVIDRGLGHWSFDKGFSIEHPEWQFTATKAVVVTSEQTANIADAQLILLKDQGRVNIGRFVQSTKEFELDAVQLTTCPAENSSWRIQFDRLSYDQSTNTLTARNAALRLGKMPVLYTPYLRWRNLDKQTGFQLPRYDYDSTDGLRFGLPYRYQINSTLSFLVTPELMTHRGPALELTIPNDDFQLEGRWIPKDRQFNGDLSRELFDRNQVGSVFNPAARWSTQLAWNRSSDTWSLKLRHIATSDLDYVRDFGVDQDSIADLASESSFEINYIKSSLAAGLRVQRFKSNLIEDSAVQALPAIDIRWIPRWSRFRLNSHFNYADFERLHENVTIASSQRIYFRQGMEAMLYKRHWAELTASVAGSYTQFDYFTSIQTQRRKISRGISSYSISGALFLRGRDDPLNRFEPRFYYLNRSFEDQDHLPIFDSWPHVFNVSRLFTDRRQTGLDRISGTHSLTVGFRSHLHGLDQNRARGVIDVGVIRRFEPERRFDNLREKMQIGWSVNLGVQDRFQLDHTSYFGLGISRFTEIHTQASYRFGTRSFTSIGYAQNKALDFEQAHLGVQFPVSDKWHLIGAINRDIQHRQAFERIVGIGFNGCCLNWRLVYRDLLKADRYRDLIQTKENSKLYLQIELKGFASLGTKVESLLASKIPGFNIH